MPRQPLPVPNQLRDMSLAEVHKLDPALFEDEPARTITRLGATAIAELTAVFGTPAEPYWASAAHEEDVFMAYHNGGLDGHTSVGSNGAGVPRNVLLATNRINQAANTEIYTPLMRATSFYSAAKHDILQLCGRTLLQEGQRSPAHGDERRSAWEAQESLLYNGIAPAIAQQAHDEVMGTAFNPRTGTQNVDYDAWDPRDRDSTDRMLGIEATTASDLLGTTGKRGRLGAWEYAMETLTMHQKEQVAQQRLAARGVSQWRIKSPDDMMRFIARDKALRDVFNGQLVGQAAFLGGLQFSDRVIRSQCGAGIADLFPGLSANAVALAKDAVAFREARTSAERMAIWESVKAAARQS